jgi:hypothetical protein
MCGRQTRHVPGGGYSIVASMPPPCAAWLPWALGLRPLPHAVPGIPPLDRRYGVKGRPVSLVVRLRSIGVLICVVGRFIFHRRKRRPRCLVVLLRMTRDSRQCDCCDCDHEDSHRLPSSRPRHDRPSKRYKMIHQKAIAQVCGPARYTCLATLFGLWPEAAARVAPSNTNWNLQLSRRGASSTFPSAPSMGGSNNIAQLKISARAIGPARCRFANLTGSEGYADAREPNPDVLAGLADARELGDS